MMDKDFLIVVLNHAHMQRDNPEDPNPLVTIMINREFIVSPTNLFSSHFLYLKLILSEH